MRPVHDLLPYLSAQQASPLRWPGGARLAVWVVPNVEHYEYLPPVGAVDPYPRLPHPDVRKYAYHDYGNRVGFWRLLDVLDTYQIRCTVSLNVAVLDHYPQIATAMMDRNWEFMCHGLYNTQYLTGISEAEERQLIELCNNVLRRHTGHEFTGFLGPNITSNQWTPQLLADVGFSYQADWVHDERPSPLTVHGPNKLVAMPYSYELNDAPLLMRSHVEGPQYVQLCIDQFTQLYQESSADDGRMMCLPLHPFAIGQPHRIDYLAELLAHIREHQDVWFATGAEIAAHYLAFNYSADVAASGGDDARS